MRFTAGVFSILKRVEPRPTIVVYLRCLVYAFPESIPLGAAFNRTFGDSG